MPEIPAGIRKTTFPGLSGRDDNGKRKMQKNVIVIGAGAAGLMAAVTAAENGHKVTVLEKTEKAGKKIWGNPRRI